MILSVDPGVQHCGFALWDDGELQRAWLHTCENGHAIIGLGLAGRFPGPPYPGITEIVVERPQIYPAMKMRGDPNDLVSIAIVGAEIVGQTLCNWGEGVGVTYYYPRSWKGNVDKSAHQPRILALLSSDETSMIELPRAKALHHNIIDAVGIGLYHLGRMERGKKKAS